MADPLKSIRHAFLAKWSSKEPDIDFLEEHTKIIDNFVRNTFDACIPTQQGSNTALIALGGYGRRELFPYSDIDLMLVYENAKESHISCLTEGIFYPLWDSGMETGHSVRTPEQCLHDVEKDFFLKVSILDARLICGDEELFSELISVFESESIEGRRKEFVKELILQRKERHRRFGSHAYLLEPNIKEGRGGLRDMQTMLWASKALLGIHDFKGLEEAGLLLEEERNTLEDAREKLFSLRNRLHMASKRKNDRLYFEYQEELFKAMGRYSSSGMTAAEGLVKEVQGYMQRIAIISDTFFEHMEEVLTPPMPHEDDKPLETGIAVKNGKIQLTDPSIINKHPHILMKLFVHSAKTGLPVHYDSRRKVKSGLHLLRKEQLRSKRMIKAFFEILEGPKNSLTTLEAILETGILQAFIPEFSNVSCLVQHDVYHVNTVDRHLLETVAALHNIHPEKKKIFDDLKNPRILYLAALIHDIGKGQGKDHSESGARLAEKIGKRLQLSQEEVSTLSFLVKKHLFLMLTALTRDLDDELFVIKCARDIKDIDSLNMLYLLSIADAMATGPSAWNEWKGALLSEFYLKILHLLQRSDFLDPDKEKAVAWMKEQVLKEMGKVGEEILEILPEEYLLSFTPQAIKSHMILKNDLTDSNILVVPKKRGEYWSTLFMAKDRTGLLSKIFGVLAMHNLHVLSASIFTLKDDTALDVMDIKPAFSNHESASDWDQIKKDISMAIQDRLGIEHRLADKNFIYEKNIPSFCVRSDVKVVFDNISSDFHSIIEVHARERAGLLYNITKTLAEFGINIHKARIGTQDDRIIDVFYVLDRFGEKIEEQAFLQEIEASLIHAAKCK